MRELFPAADYRFQMGLKPGQTRDFFGISPAHAAIIAERRRWLDAAPRTYAALLPEGDLLLDEALEVAASAAALTGDSLRQLRDGGTAWERCVELGRMWEPDFLLLQQSEEGPFHLLGGVVCFPSSWSLSEKMGRALEVIHSVVPGLNSQLGPRISAFLARMKPGLAWLRSNWGLSRSAELNQHPERGLAKLDASVPLHKIWLRIEHQALLALPRSRGVLFGIRIAVHPISEVQRDRTLARGLARALKTMPAELARYKNIQDIREKLSDALEASTAP